MIIDEVEILEAIRQGEDSRVFEQLYQHTYGKIKGFVRKSGGSNDDAQDLFQDAVMIFYRQVSLGKYNHQTEIDGYIFTVARNAWYTKMRRKKPQEDINDVQVQEDANTPESIIDHKERDNVVMALFETLGERCKDLLVNTIYYDMSLKELVENMGFSTIDAAKTKNYKCKQRLIKLVKGNASLKELLRA